jgi:hypothetical protein
MTGDDRQSEQTKKDYKMKKGIEMNSAQDISNEATVAYYADQIKHEMKTATGAWRAVANLFASASNEFGTDSDKFKALVKETNFSRSKVYKLIAIANDGRLKMYEDTLQCVMAWTVMYEITTLKDHEFQRFTNIVYGDTVITIKEVNAARDKEIVIADPFKTLFSIQIDENALKAQLFSGDEYQELLDAIETIQNTMNYVRVQQTSVFENDVARFHSQVERFCDRLVRKKLHDEKTAFFANCEDSSKIALIKEALKEASADGDYDTAFALIDSEGVDYSELRNVAEETVRNLRHDKNASKATVYNAFANTEIRVAA